MKQKSSKFQGTAAINSMTAEQAANASTNVKIETKKIYPVSRKNPKTLGNESVNESFADLDLELEDTGRDVDMGRRIYEIEGVKYRIRQCNPYALWEVVGEKGGNVPFEVSGRFTSLHELETALSRLQAHRSARGSINKAHRQKLEDAGFFDRIEENVDG